MKSNQQIILFFFIIFISSVVKCKYSQPLYKCQHNTKVDQNPLPNFIAKVSNEQKKNQRRRIESELDSDGFKKFNIYLDFANLKDEIASNGLSEYEEIFISSMEKAKNVLESLLKVKPLQFPYILNDQNFVQLEINNYNREYFGDEAVNNGKNFQSLGIDLAIFGTLVDLDSKTLATANARAYQNSTTCNGQPYIGIVRINKNIDFSLPNSKEYFQVILIHEFTHIIGFSTHFFQTYYKNIFSKTDNFGITRYYLNSTKLLEVAKKYFNCPSLDGVELENQGGEGTAGAHWEARILLGEYMNGYSYTEEQVISEFTLAVLEDSGYYKVNYYTGGLMRFGKNKGCQFLQGQCINSPSQKINELFENEFFDSTSEGNSIDASCSSGRQSRTYNYFLKIEEIPEVYRYFKGTDIGGYEPADYCPVPLKYIEEENLAYYSGHCSTKGKGFYGSLLEYPINPFNSTSGALAASTGEVLSDHSFCFLSSLSKSSAQYSNFISYIIRANCYEIFCSEKSLTLKIFDDYIVCPRAGGKISVEGYNGYLLCPDYNLMCSGTVICNNIFDCVDKKSEIKESSYIYDYEIKTSQNIEKSKSAQLSTDNYELSTNGICIQNCKHCKEGDQCLKCRDDYGLTIEDSGEKKCYSLEHLSSGYYKNEETNIYRKCMSNCLSCTSEVNCDDCSQGYIYKQNKCILPDNPEKVIQNCHEYDTNFNCIKCKINYAFNDTKRDKCFNIQNELMAYYTEDDISYKLCVEANKNCSECYFDNNKTKIICVKCLNNFALLEKSEGFCRSKEEIGNKDGYYLINSTHAGSCSDAIENCKSCHNKTYCNQCNNGYTFVPENEGENWKNECVNNTLLIKKERITNRFDDQNNDDLDKGIAGDNSNYLSLLSSIGVKILLFLLII